MARQHVLFTTERASAPLLGRAQGKCYMSDVSGGLASKMGLGKLVVYDGIIGGLQMLDTSVVYGDLDQEGPSRSPGDLVALEISGVKLISNVLWMDHIQASGSP